ncbi:hypothetical protein [Leifsonia aquatica]|uniref:hypothetical protein n=1 Tax=Leifsonia aquatica TaxID=144185 RepID=UPI003814E888
MAENDEHPVFLSGGMRPGLTPTPVGLPRAEDVVPGSVMLDGAGIRWRATASEWVRVVLVTGREHRSLVIQARIVGVITLVFLVAVIVIAAVALAAHSTVPVVSVGPVIIVGAALGYWWTRLRRRLKAQEVAPE